VAESPSNLHHDRGTRVKRVNLQINHNKQRLLRVYHYSTMIADSIVNIHGKLTLPVFGKIEPELGSVVTLLIVTN